MFANTEKTVDRTANVNIENKKDLRMLYTPRKGSEKYAKKNLIWSLNEGTIFSRKPK